MNYDTFNCAAHKKAVESMVQTSMAACVATRDSKKCQDFYKTLDTEEDQKKKLTCSKEEVTSHIDGSVLGPAAVACAAGVIVDPIVDLGTSIGEGAAKMKIAWEKNQECSKSIDQKMQIIMAYNMDVPKEIRYPMPSKEKLQQYSCWQIEDSVNLYKKVNMTQVASKLVDRYNSPTARAGLTQDDLDFLNYYKANKSEGAGLDEIVQKLVDKLNLSLDCYTPAQAIAVRCEIAATIASIPMPAMFTARLAKLSKLAKLRVSAIEEALADLRLMGRDVRIRKATNEIANLPKPEKMELLKSELGRPDKPFSADEQKAIDLAHDACNNLGMSYGTYSGNCLRLKRTILMEKGGFSNIEADFMINRGYVGNPDTTIEKIMSDKVMFAQKKAKLGSVGEQAFGRTLTDEQIAAIISYKNAVNLASKTEKDIAIKRMQTQGLSPEEIEAVVNGTFDKGVPLAKKAEAGTIQPTTTTGSSSTLVPRQTVAGGAVPGKTAEEILKDSGAIRYNGKQVEENLAKYSPGSEELRLATDEVKKRAGAIVDSYIPELRNPPKKLDPDYVRELRADKIEKLFNDDRAQLQKAKQEAANAQGVQKQEAEAKAQAYAQRCREWVYIFRRAVSDTNYYVDMKNAAAKECQ
jgi:hypothetical protein